MERWKKIKQEKKGQMESRELQEPRKRKNKELKDRTKNFRRKKDKKK